MTKRSPRGRCLDKLDKDIALYRKRYMALIPTGVPVGGAHIDEQVRLSGLQAYKRRLLKGIADGEPPIQMTNNAHLAAVVVMDRIIDSWNQQREYQAHRSKCFFHSFLLPYDLLASG